MLNKLAVSLMFVLFISGANAQSSSEAASLNRNINSSGGYAQSTAVIGYPPYSDVWIMHSSAKTGSTAAEQRYIYNGPYYYAVLPGESYDPYAKYISVHARWYDPTAAPAVAEAPKAPHFVVYKNYVRPSDREEVFVNYLEPAPVITAKTNTIVPPHGVNYYKPLAGNEKVPIRDFRTDIWQYKDYTEKNTAAGYEVYSMSTLFSEEESD
ncbi:MAG: hypothetical protein HOP31_09835 [Ignavibacteria bacterium]|nr:hypothetical protein [Ignavibacteria bacterium]